MRQTGPRAADDLDVGAAGSGHDVVAGAALEGVEFAGDQRLQQLIVVFETKDLELKSLLLGEAAIDHIGKAGITLGFEDAVAPGLELRRGEGIEGGRQQGRRQYGESS